MIVLDSGDKIQGDATVASVVDYTIYGLDNNVLKQLTDGQLAVTTGDLYTADSVDVISTIVVVNTDTSERSINLFMTPNGGTARRIIAKDLILGAGYSLHWSGDKISMMNTSGQLVGTSSGISGLENIVEDITPQLGGELDGNGYGINLADKELIRAKLKDYSIALHDGGTGGSLEIDLEKGNMFKRNLDANCTLTFVNPAKTGDGCKFDLIIIQDSSAKTISWPASVNWASGSEPDISTVSNTYLFSFLTIDGGTTWYGDEIGGSTTPVSIFNTFVWGYNIYGQLGLGDTDTRISVTQLSIESGEIDAGSFHSSIIKSDGTLWTWGYNEDGQLGHDNTTDLSSPVKVGTLTNWSQISSGWNHMVSVKTDGTLWTWGKNNVGQLGQGTSGTGTYLSSPVKVGALTDWSKISCGYAHMASLKTDGTIWTWGYNTHGQLGHNNTTNLSSPVKVGTLTTWSKISCEYHSTGAVKTDGTLWTWGYNLDGQLGQGHTTYLSSPVKVGTLTDWSQISSGFSHMIALKTDGTIWTWGYNTHGELGHNNIIGLSSPVKVGTLTDWSQVDAGGYFSMGRRSGELYTWGNNAHGQLGLGDTTPRYVPTLLGGGCNNFSAGRYHTIATQGT